jgi:malate synthase
MLEEIMVSTTIKNIYSLVNIKMNVPFSYKQILSCKALKFLADLHINFDYRRQELLTIAEEKRSANRKKDFNGNEIVDPTIESKQSINLNGFNPKEIEIWNLEKINSTKRLSMSDNKKLLVHFDADSSIEWATLVEAQIKIKDLVAENNQLVSSEGEQMKYFTEKEFPVLVCPRNLNLVEDNFQVTGSKLCSSFFDAGLYLFHNAKMLLENDSFPCLYLNNIENYFEAKFWNEIITFAEEELELETGSIKAVVSLDGKLPEFEKRHIKEELSEHLFVT